MKRRKKKLTSSKDDSISKLIFTTVAINIVAFILILIANYLLGSHINDLTSKLEQLSRRLDEENGHKLPLLAKLKRMIDKCGSKERVILVTGSSGFIGKNLILDQVSREPKSCVVGIDVTIPHKYAGHGKFLFIDHDVSSHVFSDDKFSFQAHEDVPRVDIIYHMAGISDPETYVKIPLKTMIVNIQGTVNMMNLALLAKAPIMIASSSEIYGDPREHPQDEGYWGHPSLYNERACYSQSKRYTEALAYSFSRNHGLKVFIPRIFNAYGPFSISKVIYKLISQALKGDNLTILGNGKQTRSFLYVKDLIEGFNRLVLTQHNQPINIGSFYETSIEELAQLVASKLDAIDRVVYIENSRNEPIRRKPNLELAQKIIGWGQLKTLEEGLDLTIEATNSSLRINLEK